MDYKQYWKDRYFYLSNSWVGSYGDIVIQKAEFINDYIKKNNIKYMIII